MSVARSSPTEPGRRLSTALLRLSFVVIFGITGFLLGKEAYLRLISLHVASQFWQLTLLVVAPVVGAVVGVLVVPLAQTFFERELHAMERAIDRLAPGELVGGAIGLVTGLVVAFLVKSVLFEFVAFAGPTGGYIAIALYLTELAPRFLRGPVQFSFSKKIAGRPLQCFGAGGSTFGSSFDSGHVSLLIGLVVADRARATRLVHARCAPSKGACAARLCCC